LHDEKKKEEKLGVKCSFGKYISSFQKIPFKGVQIIHNGIK
jgi:hypothetical protein